MNRNRIIYENFKDIKCDFLDTVPRRHISSKLQVKTVESHDELCPECYSRKIIVDEIHGEVFCIRCGLILTPNEFQKIKDLIGEEK